MVIKDIGHEPVLGWPMHRPVSLDLPTDGLIEIVFVAVLINLGFVPLGWACVASDEIGHFSVRFNCITSRGMRDEQEAKTVYRAPTVHLSVLNELDNFHRLVKLLVSIVPFFLKNRQVCRVRWVLVS